MELPISICYDLMLGQVRRTNGHCRGDNHGKTDGDSDHGDCDRELKYLDNRI
ncbi:unnamed protein product [Penicillium roqueforti FM164]|uniref:Genomic scaffold, ProqFM164S01 n=1 Tax=Penicillium roqueforti (strain FM164) TaxID=1365484 RepID=W6PUP4_PENRF|nr:unnamed protein product [Penicillium roqueforti FM164]